MTNAPKKSVTHGVGPPHQSSPSLWKNLALIFVILFTISYLFPEQPKNPEFCTEWAHACKTYKPLTNTPPRLEHHTPSKSVFNRPLVLCHRGGSLAPENTLINFRKALDLGCDIIELDLHFTRDGHFILSHDPDLSRLTNLNRSSANTLFPTMFPEGHSISNTDLYISQFTLEQIKKLDFGYHWSEDGKSYPYRDQGVKAATFAEVLKSFPSTPLMVELKDPNPQAAVQSVDMIRSTGRKDVTMGTKWTPTWKKLREYAPEIAICGSKTQTMYFWFTRTFGLNNRLASVDTNRPKYDIIVAPWSHPVFRIQHSKYVDDAHANGILLYSWPVNTKEDVERALEIGLDGIITDRPDIVIPIVKNIK